MSKEYKMEQNEDEISLVDLLVVLLKHWKMIVVLPLVILAALIGYTFVKPVQKAEKKSETYITLMVNPLIKQFSSFNNLEDLISNIYIKDLDILYASIQEAGITKIGSYELPLKKEEGMYLVKSFFIDGKNPKNQTIQDADKPFLIENKNGVITITVRFNDKEQSSKFLELITLSVKTKLNELILPIAKKEVGDYERIILEDNKNASTQNLVQIRYSAYSSALQLVKGEQEIIIVSNPITVESPAPSNNSKTILFVAFFAALFFAIFLAFVLEAIENIRKDPEAMAKIRSALKKDSQ
jgi:capsular polysaccharide biosynthesis protein